MSITTLNEIDLCCTEGSSDKEWFAKIVQIDSDFVYTAVWGGRGKHHDSQSKSFPNFIDAKDHYDKKIKEKFGKLYRLKNHRDKPTIQMTTSQSLISPLKRANTGMRAQLLIPINRTRALELINDDGYAMQEKKNGKRCLLRKIEHAIIAGNRAGFEMPIPDTIHLSLTDLKHDFEIDGELMGDVFHVFDILKHNGESMKTTPYIDRNMLLDEVLENTKNTNAPVLPIFLGNEKEREFKRIEAAGLEGVVFKLLAGHYVDGVAPQTAAQFKYKCWETASCIVTKLNSKQSIAIHMLDENGGIIPVGNVTVKPKQNPQPGDIVEIKYLDMVNPGGSLIQPELIEIRDDIPAEDCSTSQIKYRGA